MGLFDRILVRFVRPRRQRSEVRYVCDNCGRTLETERIIFVDISYGSYLDTFDGSNTFCSDYCLFEWMDKQRKEIEAEHDLKKEKDGKK